MKMNELIIYVNGIENSESEAKKVTSAIQRETGLETILFYNSSIFANGVFPFSEKLFDKHVKDLQECLIENLNGKVSISIFLILHSMASVIALKALKTFPEAHKQKLQDHVTVSVYGGITVLPKTLARRVDNCLNDRDQYARAGSTISKLRDVSTVFIKSVVKSNVVKSCYVWVASWFIEEEEYEATETYLKRVGKCFDFDIRSLGLVCWDERVDHKGNILSEGRADYNVYVCSLLPSESRSRLDKQHGFMSAYFSQCCKDLKKFISQLIKESEEKWAKEKWAEILRRQIVEHSKLYCSTAELANWTLFMNNKNSVSQIVKALKERIQETPDLLASDKAEFSAELNKSEDDTDKICAVINDTHECRRLRRRERIVDNILLCLGTVVLIWIPIDGMKKQLSERALSAG